MSSNKEIDAPKWFKYAYDTAVEFHKKDSKLDAEERLDLSRRYATITKAEVAGIVTGFTAGFGGPFAYRYYTANTLKGVKLPRTFLLGIVSMVLTRTLAGKYMYNKELKKLDPTGELASKYDAESKKLASKSHEGVLVKEKDSIEKEYEVMKLLKYRAAPRWSMYFRSTYENPENRMPDPAQKLDEFKKSGRAPFSKKGCDRNERAGVESRS
ncbi:hypothetical protein RNJ44_00628 [Nakaseomyces bracarensis]|uniref:Uncharacterized protein n=1 Tax=Nakaseomyces bracarensis TaxID=273131 RepID=A0ABR4NRU8_9SACH